MNVRRLRSGEALMRSADALCEHLALRAAGFRLCPRATLCDFRDGHCRLRLAWVKTFGKSRVVCRGVFWIAA